MSSCNRVLEIVLEDGLGARGRPEVEQERAIAVQDFIDDNRFSVCNGDVGPYYLSLGLDGDRLLMKVRAAGSEKLSIFGFSLSPFRRIFKDYFIICDSYFQAIRNKPLSTIEAIDMGRRSLHDEAAEKLCEVLKEHALIDKPTARRLFTILCVLHSRV